ncbi:hypothetical protein ACJX0J_034731, partial [Zea mays]
MLYWHLAMLFLEVTRREIDGAGYLIHANYKSLKFKIVKCLYFIANGGYNLQVQCFTLNRSKINLILLTFCPSSGKLGSFFRQKLALTNLMENVDHDYIINIFDQDRMMMMMSEEF